MKGREGAEQGPYWVPLSLDWTLCSRGGGEAEAGVGGWEDLPEKEEVVIWVELSPEQRR
jgi:hypothetical protein